MTENNKPGKVKFEQFYRICVNAVKTIGINLMPDEEWTSSYPEEVANFFHYYNIFWLINGTFLLTSLCGIFVTFMDDLVSVEFLKSLVAILTGMSNYYKGFLMSRHQIKLREILKDLKILFPTSEKDQKHFEIEKVLRNLLRMKRTYLTLYVLLLMGTFIPELLLHATTGRHSNMNWTPFDINTEFRFYGNMIWLAWIALTFCIDGFGGDFVFYSTITMLTIKFKVTNFFSGCSKISIFFKKVLNESFSEAILNEANLKRFVDLHNKLIKLVDEIHDIFELYILFFIAQSSVIMALMGFQLASTGQFALQIPFLLITLNQVYLICHFGQKLHDSSVDVADGILESNWHQLKDLNMRKNIPFIIQRCQRPKVVRARGFTIIKLSTFMGVS